GGPDGDPPCPPPGSPRSGGGVGLRPGTALLTPEHGSRSRCPPASGRVTLLHPQTRTSPHPTFRVLAPGPEQPMSHVDSAFPYDPEQGPPDEVSGSFDPLDGPWVVVLLGGERGESVGRAPRAALGLVREWSREGRKMVVVDVGLEAPALHALLGEENGEG